jgi:hypothetical protein
MQWTVTEASGFYTGNRRICIILVGEGVVNTVSVLIIPEHGRMLG